MDTVGSVMSGFALGVAGSAAVAIPVYVQQKKDAKASEDRLVLLIEQQLRETERAHSTVRELTIQNEEMRRSFGDLRKDLVAARKTRTADAILNIAAEYSDVARHDALRKASSVAASSEEPPTLTIGWLQEIHEKLFPRGYELAGRLRTIRVWIGPVGKGEEEALFNPAAPDDVVPMLEALVHRWNTLRGGLRSTSRENQSFELARFHHGLVSIHPFVDGNGVLGRTVTAIQMKGISGKPAEPLRLDAEYYASLQLADEGEFGMLSRLMQAKLPL